MTVPTDIAIRRFGVDDLIPVAEVERMVFGSGGYQLLAIRQLYDLFPSLVWVATDGGKVVGHVFGAIEQGGETGWLLNFAVLAIYRRSGIGTQLLQRLFAELEKAGVKCIKTTAEVDNEDALNLYEKLGFKQIGVSANYYGDGTDRAIFERCL